jgi:hypothetical protein
LYEYKSCKSVLKKDGWEVSQYQKLLKESSEQFEFGGGGSLSSREGSRRKKKGGKKQSSRKSKKKDRHDDSEPVGGVRMEEQVHVQQPPRTQVRVCVIVYFWLIIKGYPLLFIPYPPSKTLEFLV